MPPVIECLELTKSYSTRITALNNITLTIASGTSFGLLGENGAGKSTLVRILMGFIFPTSGTVRVLGEKGIGLCYLRIPRSKFFTSYPAPEPFFKTPWQLTKPVDFVTVNGSRDKHAFLAIDAGFLNAA
jgi:ABC-type branched-subunit amino acid transport system ATPase component